MYKIGIDIGGTFTDLVLVDDTGAISIGKTASNPKDQSISVMEGLAMMANREDLTISSLLSATDRIVHGTTVATNAILERTGAKLGLLTTEGHRDILEMREGLKPERYNLRLARHSALVPRNLRYGIPERIRYTGDVEISLDEISLDMAIDFLIDAKVEAVAVCYLHSYVNPVHELKTRERLMTRMPGIYVSLSSEVLPQIKEFERVSTTVVNAYVGPILKQYLGKLQKRLNDAGYEGPALITLSHGGVTPISEAIRLAAATVLSGPAGGLAGAKYASSLLDVSQMITFDMGGTSSDISLIIDGEVILSTNRSVAGEKIALPSLEIVTLGAGGGSIAWVNTGGLLKVGPNSAGAVPGPVCYGHGGIDVTVTDANLVLGYLNSKNFLGGKNCLDLKAAETALDTLGQTLLTDRIQVAEGIFRVVNTQMAEGIRLATVRRGVDPRHFSLLGFGGAAGIHVTSLARMLGVKRVIVPRVASVLSAWGMLTTDLRYEVTRTRVDEVGELSKNEICKLFDTLQNDAMLAITEWFDGRIVVQRSADMRYGEQIFEIDVDLQEFDFTKDSLLSDLKAAFEARHEKLYTYSLPNREPVLVNAKVAAIGKLPSPPAEPNIGIDNKEEEVESRLIYVGCWTEAKIHQLEGLGAGQSLHGPAVIEADTTTILLLAGDIAYVTDTGWLDICIGS